MPGGIMQAPQKAQASVWSRWRRVDKFPKRVWSDRLGAMTVEFALGAVVFFSMVVAIFDLALVMFADSMLGRATLEAARRSQIGLVGNGATGRTQFIEALCNETRGYFDCSKFVVDVRTFADFASASTSLEGELPDDLTELDGFNRGNADEIVAFRVYYEWPVLFVDPTWTLADRGDGRKLLVATSVVRNEPVAN